MNAEGYLSSTDVRWSLRWITDKRGENRKGRQTDGEEKEQMEKGGSSNLVHWK